MVASGGGSGRGQGTGGCNFIGGCWGGGRLCRVGGCQVVVGLEGAVDGARGLPGGVNWLRGPIVDEVWEDQQL